MSAVSDVAATQQEVVLDTSGVAGHPRGLMTLFFTEMWERFSFYGMRALLVLYMTTAATSGGLGYSTPTATRIYGLYSAAVYFMSIPGGFVADFLLGAHRSVLVGGIVIAAGHFAMAFPSETSFFLGLILVCIGTGLLKPNVSTMVGRLYADGDSRRDAGFSIFYMGINLGAFLAPFVTGTLAQTEWWKANLVSMGLSPESSWHWGFGAAGVGMTFGIIQYVLGGKRFAKIAGTPNRQKSLDAAAAPRPEAAPLTTDDYKRIGAIGVLFFFTILFWTAFEQAGSSLTLFADRLTHNAFFGWEFPSSYWQSVNSLFVIALAPVFAFLWVKLGKLEPSSPIKFSLGLFFVGLGCLILVPASNMANAGLVSPMWLLCVYFLHTVGELCLSPVGLSTVTKLAPAKLVGLMMGVWFLAASLGNYAAGFVAGFFKEDDTSILISLFGGLAALTIVASLLLLLLSPIMRKLMGKVR